MLEFEASRCDRQHPIRLSTSPLTAIVYTKSTDGTHHGLTNPSSNHFGKTASYGTHKQARVLFDYVEVLFRPVVTSPFPENRPCSHSLLLGESFFNWHSTKLIVITLIGHNTRWNYKFTHMYFITILCCKVRGTIKNQHKPVSQLSVCNVQDSWPLPSSMTLRQGCKEHLTGLVGQRL